MAMYTVDANGNITPASPAFPQPIINDTLSADPSVDTTMNTLTVFIDGNFTLQSLFLGAGIEVDLGQFSSASLAGTGNITGSSDTNSILPDFVSFGSVDINGAVYTPFTSYNQLTVSAGEKLLLGGDFSGQSASAVTVATGAELDVNSLNTAFITNLTSRGVLKFTAPNSPVSGAVTLGGTVLVQGDATNGAGIGTQIARPTGNPGGAYVATLDLRQATLATPITNLTLGTDAQIRFGTGPTTLARLVVAGSATAFVPLDVVSLDGAVTVTGDRTGAANQVVISQAEFAGGNTVDFTVAASDGGAILRQSIAVDANTTLRNDAKMTIGGVGTTATTFGAAAAAAGSSFVNGTAGQLTLAPGAAISVAAIQNAGAITAAGNAAILAALTNTGTIDVASGTLNLQAATQGTGTVTVETGAALTVSAALRQASVTLRAGAQLNLTQPTTFAATLQASTIGAKVDLFGQVATSATVANGSIVVTSATGNFSIAETGLVNGASLALSSDGVGGTLLTVDASDLPHPAAFRFFDSVHGTQFLTTSATESQSLQATRSDLVYEGVGIGAADPAIDTAAAAVYRFFDTRFGTHFYTSSTTERDTVIANRSDLVSEGIGFYEHNTAQPGDVAVYRFFDSNFGTHFYTSSATERTTIAATRPDLVSEGISFYSPTNV